MSEITIIQNDNICKELFEQKFELNPVLVDGLLSTLEEWVHFQKEERLSFTEHVNIFCFNNIIFFPLDGLPRPHIHFVLLNEKFVLHVFANNSNFMEFDFQNNVNTPSDDDIEEIKNQIFTFVKKCGAFFLAADLMEKDKTTFEIKGVGEKRSLN